MIKWAVYKIYCASSTFIKHERVCVSCTRLRGKLVWI